MTFQKESVFFLGPVLTRQAPAAQVSSPVSSFNLPRAQGLQCGLLFWRQPPTVHAVPQHQTSTASKSSAVPISVTHCGRQPTSQQLPPAILLGVLCIGTPLMRHLSVNTFPQNPRGQISGKFHYYGTMTTSRRSMSQWCVHSDKILIAAWRTSSFGCSVSPCRKWLLFIFSIPILELPSFLLHLFFITLSPCYPI